jgi:hypothetical protein
MTNNKESSSNKKRVTVVDVRGLVLVQNLRGRNKSLMIDDIKSLSLFCVSARIG